MEIEISEQDIATGAALAFLKKFSGYKTIGKINYVMRAQQKAPGWSDWIVGGTVGRTNDWKVEMEVYTGDYCLHPEEGEENELSVRPAARSFLLALRVSGQVTRTWESIR